MLFRGSELTGIANIDDSHQAILDRFDRVISHVEHHDDLLTLNQLDELINFASEHFSHEETFLKSHDNGDLLKHIGIHGFMLHQLYSLKLSISGEQDSSHSAEDIREYWLAHFRFEAEKIRHLN